MKRLSGTLSFALGCIIFAAGVSVAYSQGFPNKPVRLVVPFAAGNVTDLAGRIISEKFTENTGQLGEVVKAEIAKWARVFKEANVPRTN